MFFWNWKDGCISYFLQCYGKIPPKSSLRKKSLLGSNFEGADDSKAGSREGTGRHGKAAGRTLRGRGGKGVVAVAGDWEGSAHSLG